VDAAIYELKAAELSLSEYVGKRKLAPESNKDEEL
jgi:hypothetical protein